jgi:hypothetical protein
LSDFGRGAFGLIGIAVGLLESTIGCDRLPHDLIGFELWSQYAIFRGSSPLNRVRDIPWSYRRSDAPC